MELVWLCIGGLCGGGFVGLVILGILYWRAPVGYQNSEFHYGEPGQAYSVASDDGVNYGDGGGDGN